MGTMPEVTREEMGFSKEIPPYSSPWEKKNVYPGKVNTRDAACEEKVFILYTILRLLSLLMYV